MATTTRTTRAPRGTGRRAAPATAARLLREVARLHVRAQRRALTCTGAGATQCTILTELGRAPSMTPAGLSRRLRVGRGWTSRAVGQLGQEGLVEKAGRDGDRRVVALSLTAAGVAQHERLEAALDAHVAGVIAR